MIRNRKKITKTDMNWNRHVNRRYGVGVTYKEIEKEIIWRMG